MITSALAAVTSLLVPTAIPAQTVSVDGVWQTDGYNVIVAIDNGSAQFYDLTKVSCAASDTAVQTQPGVYEGDGSRYTIRPGRMQVEGSVGVLRMHRLTALPTRCTVDTPNDPLSVFDVFWASYAENYPSFTQKGIDWKAERDRVRPLIHDGMSDDELFTLMAGMLEPLGDAHTGLHSPFDAFSGVRAGTELPSDELEAQAQTLIAKDLHGAKLTSYGDGHIQYADLPGRIGYLRLDTFGEYGDDYAADVVALDNVLDTIFRKPLCGLMIDLRVNKGGSDPLGLQIASRLTKRPYVAYVKSARTDTGFTVPQPIWVRPSNRPSYHGPVAVLTSTATVSAAESFTLALDGLSPRPVRFGDPTQGAFSDTAIRTLPNDWLIAVPSERYTSPAGRSYEGLGLPPDRRTQPFTSATFDQALKYLQR